jgi:uncharacterized membrane protein YfcA
MIGPGATAIGTNKIAAMFATGSALFVYMRNGHVAFKDYWIFALITALGAAVGSFFSPFISPEIYRWLLVAICPIILWIVYRKDLWVRKEATHEHDSKPNAKVLWGAGLACGFYDGIAGPGGGTLMFLALFLVARIPLIAAIATAKLANLASASFSLAMFTASGHVIWPKGLTLGAGMIAGAFVGATYATRHAAPLARAALLFLAGTLLLRLMIG